MPDPKIKVPDKYLESAINKNPDGWGIMAVIDGFPIAQKGGIPKEKASKGKKTPEEVKAFMDAYDYFREVPHAIHFRIQTHGNVDEENCHPYQVGKETYLMHNGTLTNFTPYSKYFNDKTKSDTWNLSNCIAEFADKRWLRNESFLKLLNILVGENNRLIFMDKRGFIIPRKDVWHDKGGILYSNNHGIEFEGTGATSKVQTFRNDKWKPHGCHSTPRASSDWSHSSHGPTDSEKSKLAANFDQNQGDIFLLNGTRFVETAGSTEDRIKKGDSCKIIALPSGEKKLTEVTKSERLSEKQQDALLKQLSFSEHLPKSINDWKALSLWGLRDLFSEEPEMVSEAIWELVHQ